MHLTTSFTVVPICKDCEYEKHYQNHFPASSSRATQPLELIHSDV